MSADILDQAAELTDFMRDKQVDAIRQAAQVEISNPTALCFWCNSETDLTRRWCDSTCRDNWERDEE